MVSPGTVLTLGIIGAVVAASVGLYAARGQIGGALTRGITQSFTDPFRDYFANLFRSSENGGTNIEAERQANLEQLQLENQAARDAAQQSYQEQYGQQVKTYQDTLAIYKTLLQEKDIVTKTTGGAPQPAAPLPKTFPGEEHRPANPLAPKNEPLFAPSPGGFYYFDFPGREYDFQAKLGSGEADKYRTADVGPRGPKSLTFLGLSKISNVGLASFAQAKNLYL